MSDWETIDPHTVRVAGVLYAINKFVLWPLGLALAVSEEDIRMLALRVPETITEGRIDLKHEPGGCHPSERFVRYAADRVSSMPELERETANRAMQRLYPGFGISPGRDDGSDSDPL